MNTAGVAELQREGERERGHPAHTDCLVSVMAVVIWSGTGEGGTTW